MKSESADWAISEAFRGFGNALFRLEPRGIKLRADAADDKSAYWDYLKPLKNGLYGFILKSLNFAADADDVYQETILHGFQYFASFRRDVEFRPWIFSIAHNEIRRHFKSARKRADIGSLNVPLISSSHEDEALVTEIYRYATKLKPREREVFFLYYESGLTIGEIEGITDLKTGYIKLLLHQARAHLKSALGVFHD